MVMALEGIRVLDLTRLLPGPYGSLLLADLGAEVVKVEQPGLGDYLRQINYPRFSSINRNKKSITLNLKRDEGKEVFYSLVKTADVVMEGNRPGVTSRLGVDYQQVSLYNPAIIYCSISGFGQDGPYSGWTGHDINYMGVAGALTLTGRVQDPPPLPIADYSSGMFAVFSILAALIAREKTGRGQYIDVSMTDGVVSWMGPLFADYQATGKVPDQSYSRRAHYGVFECSDQKYVTLGVVEDWFWNNLCRVIGRQDMADDPRYGGLAGRNLHWPDIYPVLERAFRTKSRDEWVKILNDNDVPCGPVNNIEDAARDPHILHRGILLGKEGFWGTGFPVRFLATPASVREKAPELGEHTNPLLAEAGYSIQQIDDLRQQGVI